MIKVVVVSFDQFDICNFESYAISFSTFMHKFYACLFIRETHTLEFEIATNGIPFDLQIVDAVKQCFKN